MIRRLLSRWLPKETVEALFDYEQRSRYILYLSLAFNLLYAVFKLATGVYFHSFWKIGRAHV